MRSLSFKLILAFLVVTLTGTALVAVLAVFTTTRQFNQFVVDQQQANMVANLTDYYRLYGSWEGVQNVLPFMARPNQGGNQPPPGMGATVLLDEQGRVVVQGMGYHMGDIVPPEQRTGIPIMVDGREVGRLLVRENAQQRNLAETETLFLQRVNRLLIASGAGGTAVSLLLGIWLARTLTRPVRELTTATQAIAKGELAQQVPVRSQDELGELAASFNQMSADLAHASQLRRQMTADIAHELRTPLSLILGHAEALSDGVLPPTPETFHVIHDEARRLNRLIDDLRTLTLVEAHELPLHLQPISPKILLEQVATAHTPQAQQQGVTVQVKAEPDLPQVQMDVDRMAQVLGNLIGNALRHTPTNGSIQLAAQQQNGKVQLAVQDSGSGIQPEDLPHVFERFYRGDKSRHRHAGGSGLGLAIAKSLVEGQNGRIWVESQPGSGARFVIELTV